MPATIASSEIRTLAVSRLAAPVNSAGGPEAVDVPSLGESSDGGETTTGVGLPSAPVEMTVTSDGPSSDGGEITMGVAIPSAPVDVTVTSDGALIGGEITTGVALPSAPVERTVVGLPGTSGLPLFGVSTLRL